METVQNILSMVILVIFISVVGIIVYNSNVESLGKSYESQKLEFSYNIHSNSFDTFLSIYDNESKTTMIDLATRSAREQKEIINISGVAINVKEKFYEILDETYGIGNYYLRITPKIADISLNFVIDGSSTLEDERKELAAKLPNLISTIRSQNGASGESNIIANIFILGSPVNASDNACESIFKVSQYSEINCEYLNAFHLYERPIIDPNVATLDFNTYKIDYNILPPYGSNKAGVDNVREFSGGSEDYVEADWGSGVAYVSAKMKDSARLVLIFPMSDELSTSSIAQTCFTSSLIPDRNGDKRREQKVCDFCVEACSDPNTVKRALDTVTAGTTVASDNNHVIYPIFAYDCDYPYNKRTFDSYFENLFSIQLNNGDTACNNLLCGGCSVDPDTNNICFHPECKETILTHMEYMANKTQGEIIKLSNLDQLVNSVQNGILRTLNSFEVEVGVKENISSFNYRRSIVMENNLFTEIYLEVYYDYSQKDVDEYSKYFNITSLDRRPPSIIIDGGTSHSTFLQYYNFSGFAFDLSNISQVSFHCLTGCRDSGIANGTEIWNVSGVKLKEGINMIEITAIDNSTIKNEQKEILTIQYTQPPKTCQDSDVHCIGPGKEYATLYEAIPNAVGGDLFYIFSDTYQINSVVNINTTLAGDEFNPTKFIGVGNPIFDGSGLQQTGDNAVFLIQSSIDPQTNTFSKNQWIVFENLEFRNSGYRDIKIVNSENIHLKKITSLQSYENSIYSSFSNNITIEESDFRTTVNGDCIHLSNSGDNYYIKNNYFEGCASSGINIDGNPTETTCNEGSFGPNNVFCDGISESNTIENNKITNTGSTNVGAAINLASVQKTTLQNNVIFRNLGAGISVGDVSYGNQWGSSDNILRHNTIFFQSNTGESGIEIVKNSINNEIHSNILFVGKTNTNKFGALEFDSSTINSQKLIKNNLYYRDGSDLVITNKDTSQYNITEFNFAYPNYYDTSQTINDISNIFSSISENNYDLATNSIAINNASVSNLYYDFNNNPRPENDFSDIGAYEKSFTKFYPISPTCDLLPIHLDPSDLIIHVYPSNASQLGSIIQGAPSNTTIFLHDGYYDVSTSIGLFFNKPKVTLRSYSGERDDVIIDAKYAGGQVSGILKIRADDITIADLTVQRAKNHPIHVEGVDRSIIHNVKIIDGAEQFIKINTKTYNNVLEFPDNGSIRCSHLELTSAGRPNVQNHGGSLGCYTGGVDMHAGWNWKIHDNVIKEIHCKNFYLAEHAIHLWRNTKDNIIERNLMINNARGVGFGLASGGGKRDYLPEDTQGTNFNRLTVENIGGVIRNNVVFSNIGKYADSGIALENSYNSKIYHNTIFMDNPAKAGIDFVYKNSIGNEVINNLIYVQSTKPFVRFRAGAELGKNTIQNNVEVRTGSFFDSISTYNFSLKSSASEMIDKGYNIGVTHDFENNLRDSTPDIGAYEK